MSSLDVLVVLVCMASLAGNGAAFCVYVDNTTCECASDDCDVIRNNFQKFEAALKILQNCTSDVTYICEIKRDENGIYMLRKNPEGPIHSKTCPLKVYIICMNNTDNLTQTNCNVTSPETFSKGNGPGGQENAQCQPLTPEVGPQSLPVTSSTNTTSLPASPSPTPLSFLVPGSPGFIAVMCCVGLVFAVMIFGVSLLTYLQIRKKRNSSTKKQTEGNVSKHEDDLRTSRSSRTNVPNRKDDPESQEYFVLEKLDLTYSKSVLFADEPIFSDHTQIATANSEYQDDTIYVDTADDTYDELRVRREKLHIVRSGPYGSLQIDDAYDVTANVKRKAASDVLPGSKYSSVEINTSKQTRALHRTIPDTELYERSKLPNPEDNQPNLIYENV